MRAFRALTLTAVRSSLRNRVALFFTLGLAVLFMVIFGLLVGGGSLRLRISAVDADHSAASGRFLGALRSINGVAVTVSSATAATTALRDNSTDVVLEIPSGFAAALQSPSAPPVSLHLLQGNQGSAAAAIADQVVARVLQSLTGAGRSAVSLAPPEVASVHSLTGIDFFLPAMVAYLILQSGINYVAIGLADLRARRVLRRFRATPVRPAQILAAQVVGGALTVLLQLVVLVVLGLLLFRAHVYGSWAVVAVPILLGVGAFVGIGFLLTSAARTSEAARGLATMVAFPMMFLSGVFFPVTDLPEWLQTVVKVLPLTWLVDALHRVMNEGAGLAAVAVDCAVLAVWGTVTFALATWRFRWD